jgi:hypothetical protein
MSPYRFYNIEDPTALDLLVQLDQIMESIPTLLTRVLRVPEGMDKLEFNI